MTLYSLVLLSRTNAGEVAEWLKPAVLLFPPPLFVLTGFRMFCLT
jgi:hypothetical protein